VILRPLVRRIDKQDDQLRRLMAYTRDLEQHLSQMAVAANLGHHALADPPPCVDEEEEIGDDDDEKFKSWLDAFIYAACSGAIGALSGSTRDTKVQKCSPRAYLLRYFFPFSMPSPLVCSPTRGLCLPDRGIGVRREQPVRSVPPLRFPYRHVHDHHSADHVRGCLCVCERERPDHVRA
jgi:hypothetical protein